MPDYTHSKIYKIINDKTSDTYIGSTTQRLCSRMALHRRDAKQGKGYPLYHKMREVGIDNFYIQLIQEASCSDRRELEKIEGDMIKEFKPTLNRQVASRTSKEWYSENKEIRALKSKEYREANKQQIQEKAKQYRLTNKEVLTEQKRDWYSNNRANILDKQQQPYTCQCGKTLTLGKKARHEKSLYHQNYLQCIYIE